MYEINKLHEMLVEAGINHTFMAMNKNAFGEDALQIRIYQTAYCMVLIITKRGGLALPHLKR
jgi:hypothetical protein